MKKTILYVDDEEDIRLVVSASLEDAGYRVLLAADVDQALKLAFAEFPDLVITDVMMPGESGYSLCKKLKADPSTRSVPVVFLTVMDNEQTALEAGAAAFLSKPFDEAQLRATVAEVLRPSDGRAELERGLQYLRSGDMSAATKVIEQVVQSEKGTPLEAWGRYYIGQIHQNQGRLDKAAEEFRQVLTADPAFWRAHNRLGQVSEQSGDRPRAMKHYERSLALNAGQVDVQQRLDALQQAQA